MRTADHKRINRPHIVHIHHFRFFLTLAFFHPQDKETAQHQHCRHGNRVEQVQFNLFAEQQPDYRRRYERHRQIQYETVCLAVASQAGNNIGETLAVFENHRQHGAEFG